MSTERKRKLFKTSEEPYTTDQLAELLASYPKGTKVYVGGAEFAFKPNSVHWGNVYSPNSRDFVTVESI